MKSDTSPPPILIVDDNEDDVLLLSRRLKAAGVKNPLVHFRTGGDAFLYLKELCAPTPPRALPLLMFLDINMQGLSGFDVLLWTRQQQPLAPMKIFMMSGANEEFDAQIATKLGADEFLAKFPATAELAGLLAPLFGSPSSSAR